MLTQRLSFCLLFVFVGMSLCLSDFSYESLILWHLFLFSWTFSINAIDPKTRKILQLLRLRQVRCEPSTLCYTSIANVLGFFLCLS